MLHKMTFDHFKEKDSAQKSIDTFSSEVTGNAFLTRKLLLIATINTSNYIFHVYIGIHIFHLVILGAVSVSANLDCSQALDPLKEVQAEMANPNINGPVADYCLYVFHCQFLYVHKNDINSYFGVFFFCSKGPGGGYLNSIERIMIVDFCASTCVSLF